MYWFSIVIKRNVFLRALYNRFVIIRSTTSHDFFNTATKFSRLGTHVEDFRDQDGGATGRKSQTLASRDASTGTRNQT